MSKTVLAIYIKSYNRRVLKNDSTLSCRFLKWSSFFCDKDLFYNWGTRKYRLREAVKNYFRTELQVSCVCDKGKRNGQNRLPPFCLLYTSCWNLSNRVTTLMQHKNQLRLITIPLAVGVNEGGIQHRRCFSFCRTEYLPEDDSWFGVNCRLPK